MSGCGFGRRPSPTFLPSRCSLQHRLGCSAGATTLPSRSRPLSSVCGASIRTSFETVRTSWESWRAKWSYVEAGVVVRRCSEGTHTLSASHDCSARRRMQHASVRSSFIRIGQGGAWVVDCSRCAKVRPWRPDSLPPSLSRHCQGSGSTLDTDMFRPGDEATFYRAVSGSTRFQCVARSDKDLPNMTLQQPNCPSPEVEAAIQRLTRS